MPESSRQSLPPRKRGEGQHWIPADAGMTKPGSGNIQIAGLSGFDTLTEATLEKFV